MKKSLLPLTLFVATAFNPAQAQVLPPEQAPDDLVYVAVEPCRVADTRKSSEGVIRADTFRNFRVAGTSGQLAVQGGESNCSNPRPGQDPEAVAAYILAVPNESSTGKGVLSVYPSHQAPPPVGSGSTVNFARGQTIGNTTIATLCTSGCPDSGELAILARKTDEDVVVDVQGYFYPAGTSSFVFSSSIEDIDLRTRGEGPITVLSVTIDVPEPGSISLYANTYLDSNRSTQFHYGEVACAIKVPTEGDWVDMYPVRPDYRVEPSLAMWRYNTKSDEIWNATTLTSRGEQTVDSAGAYTYVFVCSGGNHGRSRSAMLTAEFIPDS